MKKVISALIVVIVIVVGAVYFASNKVEENYQRIVDRLNDVNGFKVSENSYQKGFFGSKGSFDLIVSKDLLKNLAGKDVDEDLNFKVENEISHSVLAFVNGFDIDSKISIQNEAIKNIVASFLGSNVVATAKTKASVSGDKDVKVKFSDIDLAVKKLGQKEVFRALGSAKIAGGDDGAFVFAHPACVLFEVERIYEQPAA